MRIVEKKEENRIHFGEVPYSGVFRFGSRTFVKSNYHNAHLTNHCRTVLCVCLEDGAILELREDQFVEFKENAELHIN